MPVDKREGSPVSGGALNQSGALYPFTGWLLSPVLASAAMSLFSVSVLTSSLRLRRFERA